MLTNSGDSDSDMPPILEMELDLDRPASSSLHPKDDDDVNASEETKNRERELSIQKKLQKYPDFTNVDVILEDLNEEDIAKIKTSLINQNSCENKSDTDEGTEKIARCFIQSCRHPSSKLFDAPAERFLLKKWVENISKWQSGRIFSSFNKICANHFDSNMLKTTRKNPRGHTEQLQPWKWKLIEGAVPNNFRNYRNTAHPVRSRSQLNEVPNTSASKRKRSSKKLKTNSVEGENYTCYVPGCEMTSDSRKKLKFHKFPSSKDDRETWIFEIQRKGLAVPGDDDVLKRSHMCERHFRPTDHLDNDLDRPLQKWAIPSVFRKAGGNSSVCRSKAAAFSTLKRAAAFSTLKRAAKANASMSSCNSPAKISRKDKNENHIGDQSQNDPPVLIPVQTCTKAQMETNFIPKGQDHSPQQNLIRLPETLPFPNPPKIPESESRDTVVSSDLEIPPFDDTQDKHEAADDESPSFEPIPLAACLSSPIKSGSESESELEELSDASLQFLSSTVSNDDNENIVEVLEKTDAEMSLVTQLDLIADLEQPADLGPLTNPENGVSVALEAPALSSLSSTAASSPSASTPPSPTWKGGETTDVLPEPPSPSQRDLVKVQPDSVPASVASVSAAEADDEVDTNEPEAVGVSLESNPPENVELTSIVMQNQGSNEKRNCVPQTDGMLTPDDYSKSCDQIVEMDPKAPDESESQCQISKPKPIPQDTSLGNAAISAPKTLVLHTIGQGQIQHQGQTQGQASTGPSYSLSSAKLPLRQPPGLIPISSASRGVATTPLARWSVISGQILSQPVAHGPVAGTSYSATQNPAQRVFIKRVAAYPGSARIPLYPGQEAVRGQLRSRALLAMSAVPYVPRQPSTVTGVEVPGQSQGQGQVQVQGQRLFLRPPVFQTPTRYRYSHPNYPGVVFTPAYLKPENQHYIRMGREIREAREREAAQALSNPSNPSNESISSSNA